MLQMQKDLMPNYDKLNAILMQKTNEIYGSTMQTNPDRKTLETYQGEDENGSGSNQKSQFFSAKDEYDETHRTKRTSLSSSQSFFGFRSQSHSILGTRSNSYDPAKKNIIKNHISHKGKVKTFQSQFAEQKLQIKKLMNQQITFLKTKVAQAKKQQKNSRYEVSVLVQKIQEASGILQKKEAKAENVARQTAQLRKEVGDQQNDVDEIMNFRDCLSTETNNELHLKSEISTICQKYKKLILDQKKEREKIHQMVIQQRKI